MKIPSAQEALSRLTLKESVAYLNSSPLRAFYKEHRVPIMILQRFEQTCQELGLPCKFGVLSPYMDEGRFYHNFSHLGDVFHVRDTVFGEVRDPILDAAIWFHDIVYDPMRSDNEELSAQKALEWLGPHPEADRLRELILATKSHTASSDRSRAILIDCDLSILGASREEYAIYSANIRREYAMVPEELYKQGRLAILKQFVGQSWVFGTVEMRTRFEGRAFDNLCNEIARLQEF